MAIGIFTSDPNGSAEVYGYKGTYTVTYEGRVLYTGERNYRDDSDFYALVWDDESESVKEVGYATTRGWTYGNYATIDATPEVLDKAKNYYAKLLFERLKAAAAADARTPKVGKTVKVVKGRKVPLGTVGEVFWTGEGGYFGPRPRFRSGAWSTKGEPRIGLKTEAGEKFFLPAKNVEVLDPEEYLPDLADLERESKRADVNTYRGMMFYAPGMAVL